MEELIKPVLQVARKKHLEQTKEEATQTAIQLVTAKIREQLEEQLKADQAAGE